MNKQKMQEKEVSNEVFPLHFLIYSSIIFKLF